MDDASVWARVYAAANDTVPLSTQLCEWIAEENAAAVLYYHMARMADKNAPQLRCMAQNCAGHSRTMATLHYFLTAERGRFKQPQVVPIQELPELFSSSYRKEIKRAEVYETAANQHPYYSDTLRQMSADCRQHSTQLLHLAEQYL